MWHVIAYQVLSAALITFTNSLDPDQNQAVWHSDCVPERFFVCEKVILKKVTDDNKSMKNTQLEIQTDRK